MFNKQDVLEAAERIRGYGFFTDELIDEITKEVIEENKL